MKLLDFPNLHCPRCGTGYKFASLTGWGTLVAYHPASMCMDDHKEVRVSAKEIEVSSEPVPPTDVQQARIARDFNERVAKPHYIDKAMCIGGIGVPTGYVPRVKIDEPVHSPSQCSRCGLWHGQTCSRSDCLYTQRVKIDEPVKDRPLYSGQHCTDRGDKLTQAADGNWYYA